MEVNNQLDPKMALLGGAAAGSLETVSDVILFKKLWPVMGVKERELLVKDFANKTTAEVIKQIGTYTGSAVLKQMPVETLTEIGQEGIAIGAVELSKKDPEFLASPEFDEQKWNRYTKRLIDAGVYGGLGSIGLTGTLAGAQGTLVATQASKTYARIQQAKKEAEAQDQVNQGGVQEVAANAQRANAPQTAQALYFAAVSNCLSNGNVYVSRFWHNHQPLYWPEWNGNGSQTSRGQYAWDSITLKPTQNYGGLSAKQHPENDLVEIFGKDDRKNAYQFGPRNSLGGINANGGFAISYSGSLIDNVRQLGAGGHLGYQGNWNAGIREARGWRTQNGTGSTRMDMLGFTYHHSLGPLLPKSVFRKEIQIFKQAWWKAWGGNSDLSDHSKGFFPTEMAYSRHLVDVLVDEGFEWTLVASHHISRTSPSYNDRANPTGSYNIYSSPPNKADQISPRFDNIVS